jgi:tRNA pseudouridine38-40 synthase
MAEPRLRNIRLAVAYRGTRYGGWQRQPNATTVQELVEEAVRRVTGERADVIGSGRTDAGVHALAQVANFKTASRLEASSFTPALNAYLPPDVAVLGAEEVPLEFNSRSSALRKTYRYLIWRSAVRPVVWGEFVYHLRRPVDAGLMAEAARFFVGRRDFGSFATELDRS